MPPKKQETELVIRAVRNNRVSVYFEWQNGEDIYKVTFRENPLPSFYKSLEALSDHAASLGDFPARDAEKIVATGLTVKERGDNSIASIDATKTIKRGKGRTRVLYFSTPALAMYKDDENKGSDHMEAAEAKAIEKVIAEAKKYISGERAQGLIEFSTAAGSEEPAADATAPLPGMDETSKG